MNDCVPRLAEDPIIIIRKSERNFCDNDNCAAALLSFFKYWHNIKIASAQKAKEANNIAQKHGKPRKFDETLWQWHNEEDLEEGILNLFKRKRIRTGLEILQKKGVITIGKNPNPDFKFDQTKFFIFHPEPLKKWLLLYNQEREKNKSIESKVSEDMSLKTPDSMHPAKRTNGIGQKGVTSTKISNTKKETSAFPSEKTEVPADFSASGGESQDENSISSSQFLEKETLEPEINVMEYPKKEQ